MNAADCTPGLGVVYRAHPDVPAEDGEVVRVNDSGTLVFVRYASGIKATDPADLTPLARVICNDREARCRCHKDAGHVEAGDPVHECDPKRCTGAYSREGGEFQVVRLPFPVGDPEPWPDDDEDTVATYSALFPVPVRRGGIRYGGPA